eukprot:scaffold6622_cov50-Phaeocystis_antarctica.AAC.2
MAAQDLKKTPSANFVVKYSRIVVVSAAAVVVVVVAVVVVVVVVVVVPYSRRREAYDSGQLDGTVACELSERLYGTAAWSKCPSSQLPMRPPTAPEAHTLARGFSLGPAERTSRLES